MGASINDTSRLAPTVDISGYRIFSAGDLGEAHTLAHRALDLGQKELGYHQLGAFLANREGQGSSWIHLQWHQLVFELGVGRWHDAHARYLGHLEPVASGCQALTDAPAGLWLLALAQDGAVELPWDGVRSAALEHLSSTVSPFVALHHLLALAGAGDRATLRVWLKRQDPKNAGDRVLHGMGRALLAYADAEYGDAARLLRRELPRLWMLGGSHAQGELFQLLYRAALARSVGRSRLDIGASNQTDGAPISTN